MNNFWLLTILFITIIIGSLFLGFTNGTTTTESFQETIPQQRESLPISQNRRCGPAFGTKCPDGQCCSTYGYCGNSKAYCQKHRRKDRPLYDGDNAPLKVSECRCGPDFKTKCSGAMCCSKLGYCGISDKHCQTLRRDDPPLYDGPRAELYILESQDGRCGPIFGTRCPEGQCCSQGGFCGTGSGPCQTDRRLDYPKYDGSNVPDQLPVIYSDPNYGGSAKIIDVGGYNITELDNDTVSSVKVPSGYSVLVYRDANFMGPSIELKSNVANLADPIYNFDNRISSIVVTKL